MSCGTTEPPGRLTCVPFTLTQPSQIPTNSASPAGRLSNVNSPPALTLVHVCHTMRSSGLDAPPEMTSTTIRPFATGLGTALSSRPVTRNPGNTEQVNEFVPTVVTANLTGSAKPTGLVPPGCTTRSVLGPAGTRRDSFTPGATVRQSLLLLSQLKPGNWTSKWVSGSPPAFFALTRTTAPD